MQDRQGVHRKDRAGSPRWIFCAALAVVGLYPGSALGQAESDILASGPWLRVQARTIYHAYQIQLTPGASNGFRNLNRFYQTLAGGAGGLGPQGAISAHFSFRYETDFGTGFGRSTPNMAGIPSVDGRDDLDLLFAYVNWEGLMDGLLSLRFGRQLQLDDLAWYSFDGLKVQLHALRAAGQRFDVELYGGLPVVFDALFSSEPLLNDGIDEYDGSGLFHGLVFGGRAKYESDFGLTFSTAYRQELVLRDDTLNVFNQNLAATSGSVGTMGLQESMLGFSAGYAYRPLGLDVFARVNWNLLLGGLDRTRIGAGFHPFTNLHLRAEFLRVRPRFVGDSIFNYFNTFSYDRVRTDVEYTIFPGLEARLGYYLQVFHGSETARSQDIFAGSDLNHGPSLGVTYRHTLFTVGALAEGATNFGGNYAYGGNYRYLAVFGDAHFWAQRITGSLRLSTTTFQNDWFARIDNGAVEDPITSYNANFGLRGQWTPMISTRVNFIKNFSSRLEGGYRLYTELGIKY